jgi:hypothetical protein
LSLKKGDKTKSITQKLAILRWKNQFISCY